MWEFGQSNEEVKPSYKMSSAHCTYLLSVDISLSSEYELVTSLWAWYCSESSFWLEDGGTTLLGHRKNSCQVRCRARGITWEYCSLPGEFGFIIFSKQSREGGKEKGKSFLSHQDNKWLVLLWRVYVHLSFVKIKILGFLKVEQPICLQGNTTWQGSNGL